MIKMADLALEMLSKTYAGACAQYKALPSKPPYAYYIEKELLPAMSK